ncbi:MAG: 50S ribosomal protein L24 [Armatimonadetes bacterium]|nr:50S ribosomal protein L24 [Armatimonadota bacterium]
MQKKQNIFEGKLRLKKGDEVEILSGKDRGKRGKIVQVDPLKGFVYVEGLNMQIRHQRPQAAGRAMPSTQTGRIERPGPLHRSKVMLVDKHTSKPTRIGMGKTTDGTRGRVSKRTGEFIDNV